MRNQQEFGELIDRYRLGEARRLTVGLSISANFTRIGTVLLLAEGRGKCLRPRWMEQRHSSISAGVGRACEQFASGQLASVGELAQLRHDLSLQLAAAAGQAMAISGGNEKRLLAICVQDPGLWLRDFDGAVAWEPLVSAATLAAQTGLSVIDSLPSQDLASGGRGWPLSPLAWWLMFADRNRTVSDTARLLLNWGDTFQFTWLPESDGLDNEIPQLRHGRIPGDGFERALLARCGSGPLTAVQRDRLGAEGRIDEPLTQFWQTRFGEFNSHPAAESESESLLDESLAMIQRQGLGIADMLRTWSCHLARHLARFLESANRRRAGLPPPQVELVSAGELSGHGLLMNEINRQLNGNWYDGRSFNFQPQALDAATAAMAGLMHVDQMPLSVPWLTGCRAPRVAGRLTSGSLASFRRLIMEMGDTQPPVMKLREAV